MRLLITRARDDAGYLARRLEAMGHVTLVEPLLFIEPSGLALPALDRFAALIFTSANGVRAFTAISNRRDIIAYAVGDRTAALARKSGFGRVMSASGDVIALAKLIRETQLPAAGTLLHIAGTEVAGDLAGSLREAGYEVERVALYRAAAATALSGKTCAVLKAREIDGVLLYSPRTAALFAELVQKAGLTSAMQAVRAWCLSPAVAAALPSAFKPEIVTAPYPTQDALLGLIEAGSRNAPSETSSSDIATALEN